MRGWNSRRLARKGSEALDEHGGPPLSPARTLDTERAFLRAGDNCFRQVAARVHDVYYQTDRSGLVTDVGAAYTSVWRQTASVIGRPWFHAVHEDDVERVEHARSRLVREGDTFDERYRIIHADGAVRTIHDRAFLFEALGRIGGVARDVTLDGADRVGHEHAERLRTLGMLASSVAHDFGNVVQGVAACLDIALMDSVSPLKARKYMSEARASLRNGSELVKQLMAFSRKEVARAQPLALDPAIARCGMMLAHLLGTRVALQIEAGAPGGAILAQPVQLEQILLNLAANARDAMPGGGSFMIRTRRRWARTSAGRKGVLELEVRDTGHGMDAETQRRMFEPFFTTKPAGGGTGLGLAAVQAVTAALEGELLVDSALGQGTAFLFRFPEVEVPGRASDVVSPQVSGDAGRTPDAARPRHATTGVFRRGTEPR